MRGKTCLRDIFAAVLGTTCQATPKI